MMRDDIATVAAALGVNLATAEGGKTGLLTMHSLLAIVSRNRAYTDSHPGFTSGQWKRFLPYDGRDFCFYYSEDCNDDHVATALRRIKAELIASPAQIAATV